MRVTQPEPHLYARHIFVHLCLRSVYGRLHYKLQFAVIVYADMSPYLSWRSFLEYVVNCHQMKCDFLWIKKESWTTHDLVPPKKSLWYAFLWWRRYQRHSIPGEEKCTIAPNKCHVLFSLSQSAGEKEVSLSESAILLNLRAACLLEHIFGDDGWSLHLGWIGQKDKDHFAIYAMGEKCRSVGRQASSLFSAHTNLTALTRG